MNLQTCRIALRPRGPLESFDLGFTLIRAWWRPLARLSLAVVLPAWILCCLLGAAVRWHWAVGLVPLALGPLLQAPFTLLGGRLLFDEDARIREVAADLRARALPSWIGALCLQLVAFLGSLATCGAAAIPSAVWMVFLPECALLERVAPVRGLRRSWRLSSGSAGGAVTGALGRWALAAWCAAVAEASGQALISYVFQANLAIPSALDGFATPWVLLGLLGSSPLWAIWRLMLYVDARTRVEGWDLQVGLRAAGLAR